MIKDLVFPPKCAGCDEKFNMFSSNYNRDEVFCNKCRADWERVKLLPCSNCRRASIDCQCVPKLLEGTDVISLFKYGRMPAADKMIYSLKRKRIPRNYAFASGELVRRLSVFINEREMAPEDILIVNVPRKQRSVKRYGFDHAERLAREIADRMGVPYASALKRRKNGKDQKKKSRRERLELSRDGFGLSKKQRDMIKGRNVILVDDVVTTGATASACVGILKPLDPKSVTVLCLAESSIVK